MFLLKFIILFLTIITTTLVYPQNKIINVCSDDNDERPFLMIKDEETTGIYSDLIMRAVALAKETSSYRLKITPMPWNRCLDMLKQGQVDAVLNISYNTERAEFIQYPNDAGKNESKPCEAKMKLYCGGYVVITMKTFFGEFNGNLRKLPIPVRVARGYSITTELENILKENVEVGKSDDINLKKLLRDRNGSVIIYSSFIDNHINLKYKNDKEIFSKVKIHKTPYTIKSYYFAFSKYSKITQKERGVIWKSIKNVNENRSILNLIYKKYEKE